MTGAKLLYDAYELESETNQLPENVKRLILGIEKAAWPNLDFFVTVSDSIRQWYLQTYGTKPSELVMNSPVFSDKVETNRSQYLRKLFGMPPGQPICVCVGNISAGWGIEILLDVFSDSSCKSAVVFLGDGDSALAK